ncbi:MAG: DUF4384 domain-containing protein [gamma proteobacterium symbiont of Taylorina sp.]|nr:DUF4384 domain-containing protein [gamma proteobacterium symbiont of Taylorina sp.]
MIKRKKRKFRFCILSGLIALIILTSDVNAQSEVGIITNMEGNISIISGDKRTADFGDDLILKDKIKVGENSSLVLTYYAGCRQEWFGENTILEVGSDKSKVISGKIEKSEAFDCEVPEVVLSDKDSFKKAAFHFRSIPAEKTVKNNQQPQTIPAITSGSIKVGANKEQTGDVKLRIWTAKKKGMPYHSGEQIIIYLVADKNAYLMLDYFQADGNVVHLVPNLFAEKRKIKAGQIYVIGGKKSKLKLITKSPYGRETVSALVSTSPLAGDFESFDLTEESNYYKQKLEKILSKNRQAKVAEYALDLLTIP